VKKYLALLLAAIFILSFAVAAFAEDKPEITLGGKLVLRGWYFDNIDSDSLPARTESQALYTSNVYLTVDAKVTDNVRGFIELETASGTAGSQYSGVYYWGTYDGKPAADILLRQAWVQYTGSGLIGVPVGIKAGHMLLSLGEKIFLDMTRFGTDAIVVWTDPTKELHIGAITAKLVEGPTAIGSINHHDDLDAYILLGTYMFDKDSTVGLNYTLIHSDGNLPSLGSTPNSDSVNFQNVGAHVNGKVAGLTYAAEADIQFGKVKNIDFSDEDVKFSGWAVLAKLGYMIDPVNIRASFAMGSGDKETDDNKIGEFQALVGSDSIGAIARFTHYTLVYERLVRTSAAEQVVTTTAGGNIRTTGIANTTYYNLGFDLNPMKELSMSLDGFFLRATKNQIWEDATGESVSKDLGWEVDLKASYKLAKNLTYFVEAGYFNAGNFYDDVFGADSDIKNATQVMHGLKLEF
jgi:predicted porin